MTVKEMIEYAPIEPIMLKGARTGKILYRSWVNRKDTLKRFECEHACMIESAIRAYEGKHAFSYIVIHVSGL